MENQEEIKPICPYCKNELEKFPIANIKCPFCKKYIHFIKSPKTQQKQLATDEEAKNIRLEWDEIHEKNKIPFDIQIKNYMEIIRETKDNHQLKMLCFNIALALFNEGKEEYFKFLQLTRKYELLKIAELSDNDFASVKNVRIYSEHCCDSCLKLNDKKLTIKKALETMPIPNPNCTYKSMNGKGWCVCMYSPVIEIDGKEIKPNYHKKGTPWIPPTKTEPDKDTIGWVLVNGEKRYF